MHQFRDVQDVIPNLFREQYTKMTAVLCRHFGLENIEIAEDIVSDTFLKASEVWALEGIPKNPEAWLYTVAKNKAKDYFKHQAVFEKKVKPSLSFTENTLPVEIDSSLISDSQLAMIFAICDPMIVVEGQISLALQILCGFSIDEIAYALLAKRETIKKRIFRAKNYLRASSFKIQALSNRQINDRLPSVYKTLYLLFNEGYYSKTNNQIIRHDLCYDALRLTLLLTENKVTNTAEANALLALMCYQSSRLESRTDKQGEIIYFEDQDQSLWNTALINKGNAYLIQATANKQTSKYHLEAGIAYWHTSKDQKAKWKPILDLYNQLILIEYSPITALNRTFAFAKVYGFKEGIKEAEKLNLTKLSYYYELLAYLSKNDTKEKVIEYYKRALELTSSETEKYQIQKKIDKLLPLVT